MESRRIGSPLSRRPDPLEPPDDGSFEIPFPPLRGAAADWSPPEPGEEEQELIDKYAGKTWDHVTRDGVIKIPFPPERNDPQEPPIQEFLDFQRMSGLRELREHPDRFCPIHHVTLGGGRFVLSRQRVAYYGRRSAKAYVLIDGICGHCVRERILREQPELLTTPKQRRAPTKGKKAGQKELLVTYGDL